MKKILPVLFFFILNCRIFATPVTGISAFYRSGQVFVTWNNLSITGVKYNLYRSAVPITSGKQLASAQNLGWVADSSAINRRMTELGGGLYNFLTLDSLGTPLLPATGVFVATTTSNGSYYYAITTTAGGVEDTTIVAGGNSLKSSISELIAMPKPVLQQQTISAGNPLLLYVQFLTGVSSTIYPVMTTYGSEPANFSLLENKGTPPYAAFFKLHGGAGSFIADTSQDTILGAYANVWNIGLDDWTVGGVSGTVWIGYNQNDNVNISGKTAPGSGLDLLLTQTRIAYTIKWIDRNFPIDSTRNIVAGESDGGIGTIFTTTATPSIISLSYEYTGMFNLGFSNDPNGNVATNTGGSQRKNCDYLFGTVPNNFLDNEGMNIYNQANACLMARIQRDVSYPFMAGVNGKNDMLLGWYEKIAFYDSANANRLGGAFYWDLRTHGGGPKAWNIIPNYPKYSNAISYPAFANCSANNNPGNGLATNGDSVGTINGMLDWKNPTADSSTVWQIPLYVRNNLRTSYGAFPTPDSCTVDVTPRRLQNFKPMHGAIVYYTNTHNGVVVQSGIAMYDGDLIVVPQLKVYDDTNVLRLTIDKSSIDTETSIPINASATYKTLCGGGAEDTLNASGAGTYQWIANPACADCVVGGVGPSIIVVPTVTTTYTVTGKNINGVTGSNSIVVYVVPPYTANIVSAGDTVFCAGTSDIILVSPQGNEFTYNWYFDSVLVNGVNGYQYAATDSGNVYCTISAASSTCPTSTSGLIDLHTLPQPVVTITSGPTKFCVGDSSKLTTLPDTAAYTYSWFRNDTLISGVSKNTYSASDSGIYKCRVTDSIGCYTYTQNITIRDSQCTTNVNTTLFSNPAFTIVPNPNDGNFYVMYNTGNLPNSTISFEIINLMGQLIYSQTAQAIGGIYNTEINLPSSIANGFYMLKMISGSTVITRQIVIAK